MKPAFWGLTVVISEVVSSHTKVVLLPHVWMPESLMIWCSLDLPAHPQWQRKVEVCMYLSCVTTNRLIFDSSRVWGWTWVNLRQTQHSLATVWLNFPSFPFTVPYPNTSINIKKPPKNLCRHSLIALVKWGEFKSRKNSKSSTTW